MTHPYREELAGRLDRARMGTPYRKRGCRFSSYAVDERDLEAAVAALRQSPTVEEVARVIDAGAFAGEGDLTWAARGGRRDKAAAIAARINSLYRGSKE
jgi:hypothetical protein